MRITIINNEGHFALIYKITSIIDTSTHVDSNRNSLPKIYRKYFFIDNDENTLDETVISVFKELSIKKYFL